MNLDDLQSSATSDLAAVTNAPQLEAFRIKYLGTKGLLKDAADHLKTLPGPEKRPFGQKMNEIKNQINAAYEEKKSSLATAPGGGQVVTGIDITAPGRLPFTAYHP